ncbi:hypothetical protein OUZ56_007313 [Daphnia magna]|uniref:Glycosyl hydrolase family 31 C-terminal domain-containing protein n=1 Tax=Daphnia magna TaxID=35525 RepID=A0ABQ9YYQ1_9CRUS|nr:hypothetical protein OUZ56_007313 [Daphnia magna]
MCCLSELAIRQELRQFPAPFMSLTLSDAIKGKVNSSTKEKVVDMALKMTSLHYQYSGLILTLASQAMTNGYPINRPLWWIDPTDPVAQTIDSEYLLGDDVLVAPVLQTGAVTKDIYLPKGVWRDEADPSHPVYTGPMWLYSYSAPLDILPYFTRVSPLQ